MSISFDGFVAGPNGEADWIFRNRGADSTAWIVDTLRQAGAHAMGSRTYRDMAAFWPYSETPLAKPMNDIPKIVFSRNGMKGGRQAGIPTRALADAKKDRIGDEQSVTPTAAVLRSWAEPTVACGDLVEEVARLKEQPGDFILAHGGASFAQSLVACGLIDEYRLVVYPVALGRGLPLFSGLPRPLDLRLVSTASFDSGAVGAVYRAA
jgi:dihydrofolate reductase